MTLPLRAVLGAVSGAVLVLALGACSDDAEPVADATTATTALGSETPTTDPATQTPTSTTTSAPVEPTEPTSAGTPTVEPSESVEPTPEPTAPPVDPDAPPTTFEEAQARFDAKGQEPQEVDRFRTDAGTYCLLGDPSLSGCELGRGKGVTDAAYCGEGPTDKVGRVVLTEAGPRAECNSDTIREGGAPKLAVDTVGASPSTGVRCLVEDIGTTCIRPARGDGFFLGNGAYTTFG